MRLLGIVPLALVAAGVLTAPVAAQEVRQVRWKTMVGIIQAGNVVAGIPGGGQPWSATGGDAHVDLRDGSVEFDIQGLMLAGGNSVGTRGGVAEVKGTIVCGANTPGATVRVIDTDLVPLTLQGDAKFNGDIGAVPVECGGGDLLFLVRNAAGRWLANAAVRTP
jgi:hypothetical protein